MKKTSVLALVLALLMALSLAACGGGETDKDTAGTVDAEQLEYWNGYWYGWWVGGDAAGEYEYMQGLYFDCCASVELDKNGEGTVTIWDEMLPKSSPFGIAEVKMTSDGEGGSILEQTSGEVMHTDLNESAWTFVIDSEYDHMIKILGTYTDEEGSFGYVFFLRPWGMKWDDVPADDAPYYYEDWYLPLLEDGVTVPPDAFELPEE